MRKAYARAPLRAADSVIFNDGMSLEQLAAEVACQCASALRAMIPSDSPENTA